ncbi:MAG: hypothetical protein ACRED8_09945, partial [Caulobacteraceae bacterium]
NKAEALACFASQAEPISWFPRDCERCRQAPRYRFEETPPPGEALYDRFGWTMTSQTWRSLAKSALSELGLCAEGVQP